MSGRFDYAKAYKDYGAGKYSDADFEQYVDSKGDLSGAWDLVNTYRQDGDMSKFPMHGSLTPEQQAEYWINRGATSKAAFGRSHAAEDAALYGGTYRGGTEVRPGTQAYEDYFGDATGTRFEGAMTGARDTTGGREAAAAAAAPPRAITGGGAPGSSLYPMGLIDYEAPTAMPGIPLEYQPWLQPDHIPDSLWNYQPPTLQEWSLDPRMGWADTPVSEFAPKEESPSTRADGEGTQWGGGSQPDLTYGDGGDYSHLADKNSGYSSLENALSGITIADEARAASVATGLAGSGNVGATTAAFGSVNPVTPADDRQGVTYGGVASIL